MNHHYYIENSFRKLSNDAALKISVIYFLAASFFVFLKNYLYASDTGDSFNDFYNYTLSSLGVVVITSIILYFLVKKNVSKLRILNKEKEILFKQLGLFFERMPASVMITDVNSVITNWNPGAEKLFGYSKEDAIGKLSFDIVIPPDVKTHIEKFIDELLDGKDTSVTTYDNVTKNGNRIVCRWHFTSLFDEYHKFVGLMGVADDITQKIKREEELIKLLSAVEENPAAIVITGINGTLEYVNPSAVEDTGYSKEELIGKAPEKMFQSEQVPNEVSQDLMNTINAGKIWKGELLNKKKSGDMYWANVTIAPIKNNKGEVTHFVGIQQDITEKKLKDEKIKQSLVEKELMLKEIHHRVKNNLQIISSLLSLQSRNIKDPEMKKLFNISRDRVHSMSLVHMQLYEKNDLVKIDFEKYTRTLSEQLLFTYCGKDDRRIEINTNAPKITFGIDTAIPCGLILNELLVNSIKHGFNGSRSGSINVEIKELLTGKFLLTVADNGIGITHSQKDGKELGMGLQLIESLTSQLGGYIKISNGIGTKFEIEFEEALPRTSLVH